MLSRPFGIRTAYASSQSLLELYQLLLMAFEIRMERDSQQFFRYVCARLLTQWISGQTAA